MRAFLSVVHNKWPTISALLYTLSMKRRMISFSLYVDYCQENTKIANLKIIYPSWGLMLVELFRVLEVPDNRASSKL